MIINQKNQKGGSIITIHRLHIGYLKIQSPDSKKTLEDDQHRERHAAP